MIGARLHLINVGIILIGPDLTHNPGFTLGGVTGFVHAGIALTRCRKSSRVVLLQELAIDGQHTSGTLHV